MCLKANQLADSRAGVQFNSQTAQAHLLYLPSAAPIRNWLHSVWSSLQLHFLWSDFTTSSPVIYGVGLKLKILGFMSEQCCKLRVLTMVTSSNCQTRSHRWFLEPSSLWLPVPGSFHLIYAKISLHPSLDVFKWEAVTQWLIFDSHCPSYTECAETFVAVISSVSRFVMAIESPSDSNSAWGREYRK